MECQGAVKGVEIKRKEKWRKGSRGMDDGRISAGIQDSGQESRVLASAYRGASAIFTACNVKTNVWATSTGTSKQEKHCVSRNCRCSVTAAYASF